MNPKSDREAIALIIDGLHAAGCVVTGVIDAEDDRIEFDHDDVEGMLDHLMSCDDGSMEVFIPMLDTGSWIYFVFGNDPEEVVADHGESLSPFIDHIVRPWWDNM